MRVVSRLPSSSEIAAIDERVKAVLRAALSVYRVHGDLLRFVGEAP